MGIVKKVVSDRHGSRYHDYGHDHSQGNKVYESVIEEERNRQRKKLEEGEEAEIKGNLKRSGYVSWKPK